MRLLFVAFAFLLIVPAVAAAKSIIGSAKAERIRGTAEADLIDVVAGGRDTVTCGRGRDVVNADPGDRIAADCELVSRRVSFDALRSGGQHQTQVEPSVAAWQDTLVAAFQVARFSDAGAAAIGWARSTDGGRTWRSGLLPRLTSSGQSPGAALRVTDPVVAYDALHGTWLVATLGLSLGGRATTSTVSVSRSADGRAWKAPVIVARATRPTGAYDKEWVVCDNGTSSAFRGSCYLAYSDFVANQLTVQISRDGGVTWGPKVNASSDAGGFVSGAVPVVQPNGVVTITFQAAQQDAGLYAVRTTDGGATWGVRVTISRLNVFVPRDLRIPPFQTTAVDASGRLYTAWADCGTRTSCNGADIVLSSSADGLSWTPPARVPGLGFDRYVPALAAHPTAAGKLGLFFYYRPTDNCAPERAYLRRPVCRISAGYTVSDDGGVRWRAPRRLDARAMPYSWLAQTGGGYFVGDYAGAAWTADGAFVPFFALAGPKRRGTKHQAMFSGRMP